MSPTVSVVVTCYNYGRFVAQAVDSLLGQTFRDLEVIVIDDASSDESPEVLARYASDPRVRLIRHERNRGHIASYNEGLGLASGAYVGVLAADDYLSDASALARQVEQFEQHPEVGFVYSAYTLVDSSGAVLSISRPREHDYVTSGPEEFRRLVWQNHVPHSGTLVRRACHEGLGWYDSRLPHSGDWDLWLRIATRYSVAYIADPLLAYRIHSTNMSHAKVSPGEATDELLLTLDRNFALLATAGGVPANVKALRTPATRHALLQTGWIDLFHGRRRRAWQALVHGVRRKPLLMLNAETWGFLARLTVLTALGSGCYRRIAVALGWEGTAASSSPAPSSSRDQANGRSAATWVRV